MLKSAATKLAHSSTVSAIAGNKALRPLQDLITAEKTIITSLEQLSVHFSRASDALRIWAHGEGDDLSDTLGASTKLLLEFSLSLRNFSAHESTIREHMKAVRTHEESLDRLKTRRKTVASKADSAERKLTKMDSSHKDAATQSNLLEQLRDTIRELDSEILTGEAKLGDLKRTATKAWMILKLGGLEECCRKGLIVAESGKLIMTELSQETTEPGFTRPVYTGNVRTEAYVADALRALGEISIDASTPSGRAQPQMDANYQDSGLNVTPYSLPDNDSTASLGRGGLPGDGDATSQYRHRYDNGAPRPSLGEVGDYGRLPAANQTDEHGAFLPQPDITRFQSFNSRKPPPLSSPNATLRDDLPPLSQQVVSPVPTGGRFATFPGRRDSATQMIAEPLSATRSTFEDMALLSPPNRDAEDVAPRYEAIEGTHTPPPAPPPGAAPPVLHYSNLYGGYGSGSYDREPAFVPDNVSEKEDDIQLPYMTSERRVPFGSRPLPMPRQLAQADREAVTTETPSAPTEGESTPIATAQALISQERTLTPPPPVEDLDDERALNAAAAREVSRELDSLMYHPPAPIQRSSPPQASAPAPLSIPPAASSPPRSSSESVTHPSSPFTRSRGRGAGSPQTPRSSTEQPPASNVAPSPHVAQLPSSPKPQASLPPPNIAAALPSSPSPSNASTPPFRTPPEVPPSPTLMQRSLPQSPAVPHSPARRPPHPRAGAGMISAAAFRRQTPRAGSEPQPSPSPGTRDVSPLSIKKKGSRNSPNAPLIRGAYNPLPPLPGAQLSGPVTSTPPEQYLGQEEEFDYLSAYYLNNGGDEEPSATSNVLR